MVTRPSTYRNVRRWHRIYVTHRPRERNAYPGGHARERARRSSFPSRSLRYAPAPRATPGWQMAAKRRDTGSYSQLELACALAAPPQRPPSSRSACSELLFWWATPLIRLGGGRPLQPAAGGCCRLLKKSYYYNTCIRPYRAGRGWAHGRTYI